MLAHLRLDLLLLTRNVWHVVSMMCSALTMIVLLRFGLPPTFNESQFLPAFELSVLVITLLNATQSTFREDAQEGRIIHWQTGHVSIEWVVASRFLTFLIGICLPMVSMFCAVTLLITESTIFQIITQQFGILLLVSACVIACGLLCSSIAVYFQQAAFMTYLLIMPVLFSIIIFAAIALREHSSTDITLLISATLVIIPLACFSGSAILRLYSN